MAKEITSIDKMIAIEKMLVSMGYNTEGMTVNQVLDIKKAIEKTVDKVKIPLAL
jgi:hypothetical protein